MPDQDQDEKNVRATYSIPKSIWRWFKRKAAEEDTTASELVTQMAKEKIAKEREEKKGKEEGKE